MAVIRERKSKSGQSSYHVQIRLKDNHQTKSFQSKEDAELWANTTEENHRRDQFMKDLFNVKNLTIQDIVCILDVYEVDYLFEENESAFTIRILKSKIEELQI